MQTFSHNPLSGLPEIVPGQRSEEKLEKNDICYLRVKERFLFLLNDMLKRDK